MRQLALILTASLDGFIAETDGGIDWLLAPPEEAPPDYLELFRSVDCLVMGSTTYSVSLQLDGGTDIFAGKDVFVFTSHDNLPALPGTTFVHGPAEQFVAELKKLVGGTIWLFGGGMLATALSDAGLVDDYLIVIQPILLGDGIPLWVTPHRRTKLKLVTARPWANGIAELRFKREILG